MFPTGISVTTPAFNRTSYIAYRTIPAANEHVTLALTFKARRLHDALLLYSAFSTDGNGDYISLALRDEYLEFRFDSGSGEGVAPALTPRVDVGLEHCHLRQL